MSPIAQEAPAAHKSPAASHQFDYLVPINICITSQPAASQQQQQPSISEQPLIESIAWALVCRTPTSAGRLEWTRSTRCCTPTSRSSPAEAAAALSEAIQQVSSGGLEI